MKILITGGAGFIGSHTARELLATGHTISIFDSFVSSSRDTVVEGVQTIEGDIRDKDSVQKAMAGIEGVVHLAALVSVPLSIKDPELTQAVNVEGTKNIIDAARENGVQRIVYASSAAVYGNDPSVPKREDSPIQPESPYASSKVENERLANSAGLSAMGLRFFNVYGPGQTGSHPYASVIPRWMEALTAGKPITLYGDGTQTRDFVHVRDVALALRLALTSPTEGVANVASGEERTLISVIHILESALGHSIEVDTLPSRAGDILRSFADTSHARETIGFTATTSFKDGLTELAKEYGLLN